MHSTSSLLKVVNVCVTSNIAVDRVQLGIVLTYKMQTRIYYTLTTTTDLGVFCVMIAQLSMIEN